MLKRLGKNILCYLLERQVKKLRGKHDFKLVVVVGSVGKTTTKLAIASVLGEAGSTQFQNGNYNHRLTVPLALFGHHQPNIFDIFGWFKVLSANNKTIKSGFAYKYAVLELGTDTPGDIEKFAYLKPDLAVVTGIAEEHMEFFDSLDKVAEEELAVAKYSKKTLINTDDSNEKYLVKIAYKSYGIDTVADYQAAPVSNHGLVSQTARISFPGGEELEATISLLGEQGLKMALAAAAACDLLSIETSAITKGLNKIRPVAGRLNRLNGASNSIIIDDTYNASPISVKAALDVLYAAKAPQKIAILGSMNELGEFSEQAHHQVGEYCDKNNIDHLFTIGKMAGQWLVPAAEKKGCKVEAFTNPYDAGRRAREVLEEGAVVLAKGSQNGVFAEEAVKILLANLSDSSKLVRQSEYWLAKKKKQFSKD